MPDRQDLDAIVRDWPYQPGVISARRVCAGDGREVLQMRIELGLLQMEITGRPDGEKPGGQETYLDELIRDSFNRDEQFTLTEDECLEVDREFLQYYHRRICYLALRDFARAIADADHTLALMDFVAEHSPDADWTLSHERYRPFVLFHRTQAGAMAALQDSNADSAIEEVTNGLDRIREAFVAMDAEDQFDEDELVAQLLELKEFLRREYDVGPTLAEQLAEAVANEEYERAAALRDEIARREKRV